MLRGMLRQFRLRSWRGWRELHEGDYFLPAFRSRDRPPDNRGTHHAGMRVQYRLNFGRVDILSEADDQFLGSANDEEISVFQASQVARVKPSVGIERGSRFFGRVIIALHHIGAAHPQFADFSICDWL